jgi:TfoX/Sxy family transcriptional regulator of competence genes
MPYNEQLADRVREALMDEGEIIEKRMFGGLCFMLNDKMCMCVNQTELMCRISPDRFDEVIERPATRPMIHNGKTAKNFVYVESDNVKSKKDFDFWLKAALDYNKVAQPSKPKKKK